jgi:uncharacterized protein YecT (DUF1311 family)
MGRILMTLLCVGALALAADVANAAPAHKGAATARKPARKAAKPKPAPPAPPAETWSWTAQDGPTSAAKLTGQCLEKGAPDVCAHMAFVRCRVAAADARDPQALLSCAAFARGAWDERLDADMDRLQAVMKAAGRTEPSASALQASQRKWRSWSEDDCETQTRATRGGVLHPMEIDLCLAGHAAPRAQELEQLAALWKK